MNLKINDLSKSFGGASVLSGFSYEFKKNGICFILGDSGVGKTTLLRIIAGLDTEFLGSVENGGIANVSFMFQEYRLFPTLSAVKNAALSKKDGTQDTAAKMLTRLGFKSEDLKKKPRELSGGMKQRVAFTRAVLKDAPILILDEPTKELDSDTVEIMMDIVADEAKRRLVIIVTHDDVSKMSEGADFIRL